MAGVALPVRIPPISSRRTDTALFILCSESRRDASTESLLIGCSSRHRPVDEGADGLAAKDASDVADGPQVEDADGKVVLGAEGDGRRVHHLEPATKHLHVF